MLFNLATRPEYLQPMREEVEAVINEEGWTKSAIGKLRKLDSFVRESQRMTSAFCMLCVYISSVARFLTSNSKVSVRRKVVKDFTFSNGVTVPAGTTIGIPHGCIHHDSVRIQIFRIVHHLYWVSIFFRNTIPTPRPLTGSGSPRCARRKAKA